MSKWIDRSGEMSKFFNFNCLPDNTLIQMYERLEEAEVTGHALVYVDGCTKPTSLWRHMDNNGYLYWSASLVKGSGYYQTARIHDMLVQPEFRRQGLGTRLVEAVEDRMKTFGVKTVNGTVTEMGGEFWPTLGYSIEGRTLSKSLS
jgi:GNAT superfamily N-acetyltransferase